MEHMAWDFLSVAFGIALITQRSVGWRLRYLKEEKLSAAVPEYFCPWKEREEDVKEMAGVAAGPELVQAQCSQQPR